MAIGTYTALKVYDPRIQTGFIETITQNIDLLNEASNGCIVMTTDRKPAHFDIGAFFKNTSGLVTRRDISSTGAATAVTMSQGEMVDVKLNRKIGPLDITEDALFKAGFDLDVANFVAGQQAAVHVTQNHVHTGLICLVGALAAQSANFLDITNETTKTITTDALVRALALLGDMAGRVSCWVMHSGVFFKLVQHQVAEKVTGISDLVVASASPLTLNRPVVVTDDPALVVTEGSGSAAETEYLTLGLTQGACMMHDSEGERIYFDRITGLENIVWRMQGEYAFNIGLKGLAYDIQNGGINPTDTAISTGSNWDKVMNSHKDLPGVLLRTR